MTPEDRDNARRAILRLLHHFERGVQEIAEEFPGVGTITHFMQLQAEAIEGMLDEMLGGVEQHADLLGEP